MRMDSFSRNVSICLVLLSFVGVVTARSSSGFKVLAPYVGLEYQYEHIKPAPTYHQILSANYQTGNVFVGLKYHKNFGIEIGYYNSLKTSQQQNENNNFNGLVPSTVTPLLTRTRFKGFSFDFDIYYALDPKFNIYAVLGFVSMHPTITFQASGNSDLAQAFPLIKTQNKTVPRLGVGWELLEQHWGIRSRVLWVNTQSVRFNVDAAQALYPGITDSPYLQAIQVTAGIFYRF